MFIFKKGAANENICKFDKLGFVWKTLGDVWTVANKIYQLFSIFTSQFEFGKATKLATRIIMLSV
jgi:hypothetical protein